VNLFLERDTDPFVADPDLTAADGLHPSDAGYLVWYCQLLEQTNFGNHLSISRNSSRPADTASRCRINLHSFLWGNSPETPGFGAFRGIPRHIEHFL
jgi:hypothetical protein